MNLDQFIVILQKLQNEGHGKKQMFYRVGSSGDCGELSYAFVRNKVSAEGPFDVDDKAWIEVYGGN